MTKHHLTTSPAPPDHGGEAVPFCNVCFDDVARCKANPDDCPGKPHPDDPHTQALDTLRAENDLVRRNYSGLLAFARDVSRDPLNAKRALAQELLDTGVYQEAAPGDSALRRISAAPEKPSTILATCPQCNFAFEHMVSPPTTEPTRTITESENG